MRSGRLEMKESKATPTMDTVSDSGSGRSDNFGMLYLAQFQLLPQSANSQDLKSQVQINRQPIIITILTQIIRRTGFHTQLSRLNPPDLD